TVGVASRDELVREGGLDVTDARGDPGGVVARPDHLRRAVGGVPLLTRLADAGELPYRLGVAQRRHRRVLRPQARVEVGDHDAGAGVAARPAQLVPDPAPLGQAEELWGAGGVELALLVLDDGL